MQIRVEIDVKPDELRRFLGLPDVSGLQDDIVAFLRDKVGAASEFDATGFVKNNLDTLRQSPAWRKIAARIRVGEDGEEASTPAAGPARSPRKKRAAAGPGASAGGKRRRRASASK